MWKCNKCGKEFKNNNQEHFCAEVNTIDEYIADKPEEVRPVLQTIREVIRNAAPDAKEVISWRMPTFRQNSNLIHFAAFKNHIGLYPGDLTDSPFEERLSGYKRSKGTIRLPLDKPIDYELITDITKWRVECATGKSE